METTKKVSEVFSDYKQESNIINAKWKHEHGLRNKFKIQ